MDISTGMPGGTSGRCPFCRSYVQVQMVAPTGDSICPICGSLLWYANIDGKLWLLDRTSVSEQLRNQAKELLGGGDSIAIVELTLELEDLLRE